MKYTFDNVKMARIRCQRFASHRDAERYFNKKDCTISAETMSNWEGGKHSPRLDKFLEWCAVMEINPNDLIKEKK